MCGDGCKSAAGRESKYNSHRFTAGILARVCENLTFAPCFHVRDCACNRSENLAYWSLWAVHGPHSILFAVPESKKQYVSSLYAGVRIRNNIYVIFRNRHRGLHVALDYPNRGGVSGISVENTYRLRQAAGADGLILLSACDTN